METPCTYRLLARIEFAEIEKAQIEQLKRMIANGYEHSFATSANALKGYHFLSKIAHMIMTVVMMSSVVIEKVREVGKRGFVHYIKKCLEGSVLELKATRSNKEHYLQLVA